MAYSFSEAEIHLQDGTVLSRWDQYSIDSDFLTPTDGWSFSFGSIPAWDDVRELVVPGKKLQIVIDDALQLTGWIDRVEASCSASGGVKVNVQGRDILMPLVKSNVHPDTVIKGKTVKQLIETVLEQIYDQEAPTIMLDNDANRKLLKGTAEKVESGESTRYWANPQGEGTTPDRNYDKIVEKQYRYVEKVSQKVIDYYQAQANQGAFDFLAKMLRPLGLWMWGSADGWVVVSKPNYSQSPSYKLLRRNGDTVSEVLTASYSFDKTNVPNVIVVRGKSKTKEFAKSTVKGKAIDDTGVLYCPQYVSHDNATTAEEAENYALQEMSKAKQDERVYTCTVKGHRNHRTGYLYQVDTTVHIEDEYLNLSEDMYISRRTFKKSAAQGTTTELKCVPLGSIQFSEVDAPTK